MMIEGQEADAPCKTTKVSYFTDVSKIETPKHYCTYNNDTRLRIYNGVLQYKTSCLECGLIKWVDVPVIDED